MPVSEPQESPPRTNVAQMFDRIAHRYDLLNRLLSGGTDVRWRKKMAAHLPARKSLRVLDLATGTADVLLSLEKETGGLAFGLGVDMSAGMLAHGRGKVASVGGQLHLLRGDATRLGLADDTFDVATIAFGIRNVEDVNAGLSEMLRVVAPGGRALILEFSLPENRPFRALYLAYFRNILPRLGGLISGDTSAYRYLNKTVETFPYGEAFCDLMREAGFTAVHAHPLTFGIATLYVGDKPAPGVKD